MEGERLGDGVVVGRRVRADLLELADVVVHALGGAAISGHSVSIFALAHVEEAGAVRREQPLVQAGAVVVAVEVGELEGEVREGVRAVDDHLDARARAPSGTISLHREDLAGEVGDVADQDHASCAA